jgi:hypothetical protein
MARPESDFPTIRDLRDLLSALVDQGLGGLPIQIVVTPNSTIQALARADGKGDGTPAIMIEYPREGRDLGVPFITTDRYSGGTPPWWKAH